MIDTTTPLKGRRRAALTLALVVPACAELSFGAIPLHMAWFVLPVLIPMYGAGVLLVRELVRRFKGGWPSLLLLGLAYELVEDGIGLQALSSPNLYRAAEWGPRVLGINTGYWEAQAGYHVVFSVLIPIMLVDLLFPAHRDRPYLRRGGLIGVAVLAVLGVGMVRVTVPPSQDPGYQAPLVVIAGILLAVAVLAVLALRVLPGRTPSLAPVREVPRPAVSGLFALLATLAFLGLLIPAGDPPAFGEGAWSLVPMILAAVIAVAAGRHFLRWTVTEGWSDQHRIWAAGGALMSHSVVAVYVFAQTTFDRVGQVVLAAITVLLLALLARSTAITARRDG
ncbi:hypothetical protein AB0I81_39080 [Nonomuraea sp. NPDC050404]|uniref:hypothetical protein n=1 Tax=Nonomuraea sp. NPDC050404 TaxID=3155783 RepID=UPI0033C83C2F